jgi:hypothetical protein
MARRELKVEVDVDSSPLVQGLRRVKDSFRGFDDDASESLEGRHGRARGSSRA